MEGRIKQRQSSTDPKRLSTDKEQVNSKYLRKSIKQGFQDKKFPFQMNLMKDSLTADLSK